MALKTMIENLNKARESYEKQLAAVGKNAQKAVAEFLAPLIPPGHGVRWNQYTPYFNDGESCTFSVNEPYLVRLGDEDEEDDGEENDIELRGASKLYGTADREESYETDDHNKELPRKPGALYYQREYAKKTVTYTVKGFPKIEGWTKAKIKELENAWGELPHDLLEQAFGDHVRVIVKHGGEFDVGEYSHD